MINRIRENSQILIFELNDFYYYDAKGRVFDIGEETEEMQRISDTILYKSYYDLDSLVEMLSAFHYEMIDISLENSTKEKSYLTFFNKKEDIFLTIYPKRFKVHME